MPNRTAFQVGDTAIDPGGNRRGVVQAIRAAGTGLYLQIAGTNALLNPADFFRIDQRIENVPCYDDFCDNVSQCTVVYRVWSDRSADEIRRYCSSCVEQLTSCAGCARMCTETTELYGVAGLQDEYCYACSQNSSDCCMCGRRCVTGALNGNDVCAVCAEDEDDVEQEDCGSGCDCGDAYCRGESSSLIHNYNYTPPLVFHTTRQDDIREDDTERVYLGLELEISIADRNSGAETLLNAAETDTIYLKEDGSVQGFEMVTHPMTLNAAKELIHFASLRTLRFDDGASAYNNGIHVHVSRSGFKNDVHVFKWMKLIYRNEDAVKAIARRDSGEWAAFSPDTRRQQRRFAYKDGTKGRGGERYSAINMQNRDTFEVRVFRGSLLKQEILAALELVDASVEYTRQLTTTEIRTGNGWSWSSFINWCIEQGETYLNLLAENTKRNPVSPSESIVHVQQPPPPALPQEVPPSAYVTVNYATEYVAAYRGDLLARSQQASPTSTYGTIYDDVPPTADFRIPTTSTERSA